MQARKKRRVSLGSVGSRVASGYYRAGRITNSYLSNRFYKPNPFGKHGGRYGSTTAYSLQGSSGGRRITFLGPQIMPDRYYTNFRWSVVEADTTAGGISEFIYRGNSVYDPDAAIGGTGSMGYQYMLYFYNKFRTDASAIHVTCCNIDADDPVYVSVFPSINGAAECGTLALCTDSLLWPHSKHAVATLQGGEAGVGNYGKTKNLVAREASDKDLAHDVSNNPAVQWYWHVVFFNHSGNAMNVQFNIGIKYWTECYQPRLEYYHLNTW